RSEPDPDNAHPQRTSFDPHFSLRIVCASPGPAASNADATSLARQSLARAKGRATLGVFVATPFLGGRPPGSSRLDRTAGPQARPFGDAQAATTTNDDCAPRLRWEVRVRELWGSHPREAPNLVSNRHVHYLFLSSRRLPVLH